MSNVDRVTDLFASANPVPAGDTVTTAPPPIAWDEVPDQTTTEPAMPVEEPPAPDESGQRRRTWVFAAAAALIVALVAGVVAIGTRDDGETPPVQTVAPTVPTTAAGPDDETQATAPATTVDAEPDVTLPAVPPPDPSTAPATTTPEPTELEFIGSFGDVSAGERYSSSFLGVDVEFEPPRDMFLPTHRAGVILMIDGFNNGVFLPETGVALGLTRWGGWSTREEAVSDDPVASIDPNDIDAWVAANDIIVLNDETREIAGRTARVIDITVDPASTVQASTGVDGRCFELWEPCFHSGVPASADEEGRPRAPWVSGQRVTRFYLLPIEGSAPLLLEVGAPPGSTWFDEVESTFIDSLVIGPDAPPIDL